MANDDSGLGQNDPAIRRYLEDVLGPEDAVLAEIRERSAREGLPEIAVARFDGRHLTVIARAIAARRIVEIGALGGYSGVCLARALPADGRLHTFEHDPHHADVARESFRRSGLAGKARVHVGPALENLPGIETEGPFDLVFIDADKGNYVS
jgi:caffeoyl-CoA O-methyltransferase